MSEKNGIGRAGSTQEKTKGKENSKFNIPLPYVRK